MARLLVCFLAALVSSTAAFSINDNASTTRRESLSKAASLLAGSAAILTSSPAISLAEVTDETPKITTRMGGLLEKYQDPRGWTILAPSGWNKFDGEVGAYDVKWEDLVDPTSNIKVSSTPVKSTTTSV